MKKLHLFAEHLFFLEFFPPYPPPLPPHSVFSVSYFVPVKFSVFRSVTGLLACHRSHGHFYWKAPRQEILFSRNFHGHFVTCKRSYFVTFFFIWAKICQGQDKVVTETFSRQNFHSNLFASRWLFSKSATDNHGHQQNYHGKK